MSYEAWNKAHNDKIEAALAAGNKKEAARLMKDADGFDQIDWSK
jgi:hypothetical protein